MTRRFSHARTIVVATVIAPLSVLADPLPQLALDPDGTTVSGLSSGGFMAVQMHLAFSDRIAGAAVIAGGPFYCAQDRVLEAITTCMAARSGGPDIAPLLEAAQGFATTGAIADVAGVAGDQVYLFSGSNDETVSRPVMDALHDFYRELGIPSDAISYATDVPSGHGFLSPRGSVPCGDSQSPFLNDCGIDQAGDLLAWLYGDLAAPVSPDPDRLIIFDQTQFIADPAAEGLDDHGYAYIPQSCAAGTECRLHIAFHGCNQTRTQIGDTYARQTGYLGWAEANDIVILFPQARPAALLGNPNGCWDWWGYSDPDYATRNGPQPAAVAQMAAHLGAPLKSGNFCVDHDDFNVNHWTAGRAEPCGFALCAVGSGDSIGTNFGASVLYESPTGHFSTTTCMR